MTTEKLTNPPAQADSAWKFILDAYFPQFMAFFYPALAKKIDWNIPFEALDKELQAITAEAMVGKRLIDMLFKVRSKTGQECVILLHVDVQGSYEAHFAERMYIYNYLIYNLRKLPVMTLVVLADDRPKWKPTKYQSEIWGNTITTFNFFSVKLLEWTGQETQLLEQANPFAITVAVHLAAQKTLKDPEARLDIKSTLTCRLYERGFGKDEIRNLYTFLDRIMMLPEPQKIRYNAFIDHIEAEKNMHIITSIEERGIQKGIEQGMQQANIATAKKMLKEGFKPDLVQRVTGLSDEDLEALE